MNKFKEPTRSGCSGSGYGETMDLSFLSGKTIVRVGTLDLSNSPVPISADFAIDYLDGDVVKRVVFDYNEMGIWMVSNGKKGACDPREGELRKRLVDALSAITGDVRIVDDPLRRRYVLEDEGGKEVACLSVIDLKLMGERVWRHFSSGIDRDSFQVMLSVEQWVYCLPTSF